MFCRPPSPRRTIPSCVALSLSALSRTLFRSAAAPWPFPADVIYRAVKNFTVFCACRRRSFAPSCRKCEVECRHRRRVRYSCYSLDGDYGHGIFTAATGVDLPSRLPRPSRSHRNKSVFGYCVYVHVSRPIHYNAPFRACVYRIGLYDTYSCIILSLHTSRSTWVPFASCARRRDKSQISGKGRLSTLVHNHSLPSRANLKMFFTFFISCSNGV